MRVSDACARWAAVGMEMRVAQMACFVTAVANRSQLSRPQKARQGFGEGGRCRPGAPRAGAPPGAAPTMPPAWLNDSSSDSSSQQSSPTTECTSYCDSSPGGSPQCAEKVKGVCAIKYRGVRGTCKTASPRRRRLTAAAAPTTLAVQPFRLRIHLASCKYPVCERAQVPWCRQPHRAHSCMLAALASSALYALLIRPLPQRLAVRLVAVKQLGWQEVDDEGAHLFWTGRWSPTALRGACMSLHALLTVASKHPLQHASPAAPVVWQIPPPARSAWSTCGGRSASTTSQVCLHCAVRYCCRCCCCWLPSALAPPCHCSGWLPHM